MSGNNNLQPDYNSAIQWANNYLQNPNPIDRSITIHWIIIVLLLLALAVWWWLSNYKLKKSKNTKSNDTDNTTKSIDSNHSNNT